MRLWLLEGGRYAIDEDRNMYVLDEAEPRWYANGAILPADDALIPEGFGSIADRLFYDTAAQFNEADARRLRSPERDYGVQWREGGSTWVTHRVSYIFATGELYAAALGGPNVGRVEVLASFPLVDCHTCGGTGAPRDPLDATCRSCGGTGHSTDLVERALDGWEDVCGTPGSFEWLRDVLAGFLEVA